MKQQDIQRRRHTPWALMALSLALAACGGGGAGTEPETSVQAAESQARITSSRSAAGSAAAPAQAQDTEGRLLASNCAQCHGTQGRSGFDDIRGSEADELFEFATKNAGRDIMAAHAQGYTPEQLQSIAAYLRQ